MSASKEDCDGMLMAVANRHEGNVQDVSTIHISSSSATVQFNGLWLIVLHLFQILLLCIYI